MLNAKAFAHAVTAVTAGFYAVCAVLSFIAPDFVFGLGQAWMHTVNLEAVKTSYTLSLWPFIYGLLSISAVAWVTTYAVIWLYNKWAK